jgi:hypothetical protein
MVPAVPHEDPVWQNVAPLPAAAGPGASVVRSSVAPPERILIGILL